MWGILSGLSSVVSWHWVIIFFLVFKKKILKFFVTGVALFGVCYCWRRWNGGNAGDDNNGNNDDGPDPDERRPLLQRLNFRRLLEARRPAPLEIPLDDLVRRANNDDDAPPPGALEGVAGEEAQPRRTGPYVAEHPTPSRNPIIRDPRGPPRSELTLEVSFILCCFNANVY